MATTGFEHETESSPAFGGEDCDRRMLGLRIVEHAPELEVRGTPEKETMWRRLRTFGDGWERCGRLPWVFLARVKCKRHGALYYPFDMDVWNSPQPENEAAREHRVFCDELPGRRSAVLSCG